MYPTFHSLDRRHVSCVTKAVLKANKAEGSVARLDLGLCSWSHVVLMMFLASHKTFVKDLDEIVELLHDKICMRML